MYTCSICKKEVEVNHVDAPKFSCECENAKVISDIEVSLYGVGGVSI